jgi:hypothetical protein
MYKNALFLAHDNDASGPSPVRHVYANKRVLMAVIGKGKAL